MSVRNNFSFGFAKKSQKRADDLKSAVQIAKEKSLHIEWHKEFRYSIKQPNGQIFNTNSEKDMINFVLHYSN